MIAGLSLLMGIIKKLVCKTSKYIYFDKQEIRPFTKFDQKVCLLLFGGSFIDTEK